MLDNKILKVKNIGQCIGCYSCMIGCSTIVYKDHSLLKSGIAVKTSGGYPGRMVVDICRGCIEPKCVSCCPTGALKKRAGGGVSFIEDKCNGCSSCVEGCIIGGMQFNYDEKIPIPCIQCGICVRSCPHEVLCMEARL